MVPGRHRQGALRLPDGHPLEEEGSGHQQVPADGHLDRAGPEGGGQGRPREPESPHLQQGPSGQHPHPQRLLPGLPETHDRRGDRAQAPDRLEGPLTVAYRGGDTVLSRAAGTRPGLSGELRHLRRGRALYGRGWVGQEDARSRGPRDVSSGWGIGHGLDPERDCERILPRVDSDAGGKSSPHRLHPLPEPEGAGRGTAVREALSHRRPAIRLSGRLVPPGVHERFLRGVERGDPENGPVCGARGRRRGGMVNRSVNEEVMWLAHEIRKVADAAPIKIFCAVQAQAEAASFFWPYKLFPVSGRNAMGARSNPKLCDQWILDSDIFDANATNEQILQAEENHRPDWVVPKDYLGDVDRTVESVRGFCDAYKSREGGRAELLIPLQPPYVKCYEKLRRFGDYFAVGSVRDRN